MAQPPSEYLCFGDEVYLQNDDTSVCEAKGFGDKLSLGIKTAGISGTFANLAVYKVWHQINFANAKALRKELEESIGGALTQRSGRHLGKLEQGALKEASRNEHDFEMIKGREMRYGMVITLRHGGSGRFLAISALSSEFDRDARKVVLSHDLSDELYFRVMPQLERIHSEGERIHQSDVKLIVCPPSPIATLTRFLLLFVGYLTTFPFAVPAPKQMRAPAQPIHLESVSNPGLRLQVSRPRERGQTWLEVLAATEASAFKLRLFRSVQAEKLVAARVHKPLLVGGQPVRLLHMEANGYVQAKCDPELADVQLSGEGSGGSTLIWQVEREDARDGSSIRWDARIRLRHVGTGQLLTLPTKPNFDKDGNSPLMLNALGDTTGSLFSLAPQYASDQERSPMVTTGERPLVVRKEMLASDVYRFEGVTKEVVHDLLVAKNCVESLKSFHGVFAPKATADPSVKDFEGQTEKAQYARLEHVLTEMVKFCSQSDNDDPMTREGLPQWQQQCLLCDLQFLEQAMSIIELLLLPLLKFREQQGTASCVRTLTRLAKLCQRLMRHILRRNPTTCAYAASKKRNNGQSTFVVPLQNQMSHGILAAETLREIYLDNADLLEKVTDDDIKGVLELIQSNEPGRGRKARYIEYLMVLCECEGKAVRPNQWRIANLLLSADNRKLLLDLSLKDGIVYVNGDERFFPTFRGRSGTPIELAAWYTAPVPEGTSATDHADVRLYFEKTVHLYRLLVTGRNQKNTRLLQSTLSYALVEAVITNDELHRAKPAGDDLAPRLRHPLMKLSSAFVAIARSLYVDSYTFTDDEVVPHEVMTRVKLMRVWKNVEKVYASGKLSSRLTTVLPIEWNRFNGLQVAMYEFLRTHAASQVATRIELNDCILEVLKLLCDMISFGFVLSGGRSADELQRQAATQTKRSSMGNQRTSIFGGYTKLEEEETPEEPVGPPKLGDGETPTVRQFIPILLRVVDGSGDTLEEAGDGSPKNAADGDTGRYAQWKTLTHDTITIMDCKLWACRILQAVCTMRVDIRLSRLLYTYSQNLAAIIEAELSSDAVVGADSLDGILKVLKIPQIQSEEWMHGVLLDCTRYEKPELAEAAMGLLIRQFEQKKMLRENANSVQLLVKKRMITSYELFEELLRRLARFCARRRLMEELDESFKTANILGQLTSWLYVHNDNAGDAVHAGSSVVTDHTQFIYLKLIGKVRSEVGSNWIMVELAKRLLPNEKGVLEEVEEVMLISGDAVQLEGQMYKVVAVEGLQVTLDRNFQPEGPFDEKAGAIWLMVLRHIVKADRDMQLMMLNLQGGAIIYNAMKLLALPFDMQEIRREDIKTRAVMRAVYRLLKAFSAQFPSGQSTLSPCLHRFLPHCEADLVSMDISPMGCINTMFKDNYANCAGVDSEAVHQVVRLSASLVDANKPAPRMLRFLCNLMQAKGKLIVSNQTLLVQALDTKEGILILFSKESGCKELQSLVEQNDHIVHPRGKLMYHIELIKLLSLATKGGHSVNQRWLHVRLPLEHLAECMRMKSLPHPLLHGYVDLLRTGYVTAKRISGAHASSELFVDVNQLLCATINSLVNTFSEASEAHTQVEALIFDALLPTLKDLYRLHPALLANEDETGGSNVRVQHQDQGLQKDLLRLASVVNKAGGEHVAERIKMLHKYLSSWLLVPAEADRLLAAALGRPLKPNEKHHDASASPPIKFALKAPPTKKRELGDESAPEEDNEGLIELGGRLRHPQESMSSFIEGLISQSDVDTEFEGLVKIFRGDVDRTAAGDVSMEQSVTCRLLQQLSPIEGRQLSGDQLQQTLTCLRLLSRLLETKETAEPATNREIDLRRQSTTRRQSTLNAMGASAVALSMAASDDDLLCSAGLQLCCALLHGGHLAVQDTMLALLSDPFQQEKAMPFDGSKSTFLASMRERLRLGSKEIIARKLYIEQQKTLQNTIEDETKGLGAAAKKRYNDNVNKPFPSRANVLVVLQTLRLLCEGHNTKVQDYLRVQPLEPTNVDLCLETYRLFENLSKQVDSTNTGQLNECIATLSEMVQGNELGGTTIALLGTKMLDQLSRLLNMDATSKHSKGSNLRELDVANMQREVSVLLLALLESEYEPAGTVQEHMLRSLDLEELVRLVETGFSAEEEPVQLTQHLDEEEVEVLMRTQEATCQAGLNIYICVRYLLDFELSADPYVPVTKSRQPQSLQALGSKLTDGTWRVRPEVRKFYARRVGAVEVYDSKLVLNKYFFPIPPACLMLLRGNDQTLPSIEQLKASYAAQVLWGEEETDIKELRSRIDAVHSVVARMEGSKNAVLWGCDRSKRGSQMRDFIAGVKELHFEQDHLSSLKGNRLWNLLSKHTSFAFESTFYIAVLQNVVLLVRYSASSVGITKYSWMEATANRCMGVMQVLSCIMSFASALIQTGPLLLKREELWPYDSFADKPSKWQRDDVTGIENVRLALRVPVVLLSDMRLATALFLMVAALLGLFVSPLWFSLHLIDIVNKSAILQYVFRSVTTHGNSITMTALFGVLIIYIYAAAGHGLLPRRAFEATSTNAAWGGEDPGKEYASQGAAALIGANDAGDGDGVADATTDKKQHGRLLAGEADYCQNLFHCWIAAVNEGLRSGDIGSLMYPPDPTDEWYQYLGVALYQFSFYCVVITVLLSVIFGIIIDTFSQLRTEEQDTMKHMNGVCFICGVERLTFDTQGHGFDAHIRDEHNMWQYAFMLIHVRAKDPLQYNGWEALVANKLKDDDYSFLPSSNAISLREYHERKMREANELSEKINAIEASLAATVKQVSAISEQNERMAASLHGQQQQQSAAQPSGSSTSRWSRRGSTGQRSARPSLPSLPEPEM